MSNAGIRNQSSFRKANRAFSYLKIGIEGPSGAGKTMGALLIAKGLATDPSKVAFVDTENGSGELYADDARIGLDYMYASITAPFAPMKFVELIKECVDSGMEVLVLDSLSHAWKYILNYKDVLDSRGGNSFTNWGKAKPLYEELKTAILFSPLHIIGCMRSKAEYALQAGNNGKQEVKKLGTNPIAEPENEYEFTCVFTVDKEHMATTMLTGKDRTGLFGHEAGFRITPEVGERLRHWLGTAATKGEVPAEWVALNQLGGEASIEAERELQKTAVVNEPRAATISPEGQILKLLIPSEKDRRDFKVAFAGLGVDWRVFLNAGPEGEAAEAFQARAREVLSGQKLGQPPLETSLVEVPVEEPAEITPIAIGVTTPAAAVEQDAADHNVETKVKRSAKVEPVAA